MKKVFLVSILALSVLASTKGKKTYGIDPVEYCKKKGGKIIDMVGYNICQFTDQSECEDWALFNQFCKKGQCAKWEVSKMTDITESYCRQKL